MNRARSARASCALAAALLATVVSACSGGHEKPQESATVPRPQQTPVRQPPAPPRTAVRVLDGDTSKPVEAALVDVAGERTTTDSQGFAELGVARERATMRVSAPHYGARTVRVNFRKRLVGVVELWRPELQWPMYGVSAARAQVQPAIKIRPPFKVVWSRKLNGLLEFPATVWNGVAYIGNIHGELYAISMKDGRLLWRTRVGTRMASSPGLDPARGILVTTTMNPGSAAIVSMKTGRVRWRYSTGRTEPSPLVRKRVAYFGAENGNFYALDLKRRRTRWVFRGGAKITSSPALVGNRLYFGDYAGRVFALNVRNGRVLWRGSAGSRVYGTVAVAGGRVYAPSVFSGLSALSARTGRLLWRIPVGAYLYSSPAAFRQRVYFGTYAGVVYCANARSGRILWRAAAGGRVSGAVEIVAGVVYAATLENRITAWSWRTGRRLWSFPHGQYVPVSGNGSRLLLHGYVRIWAVRAKHRR
jgi:outer membrane protein assembly factor BamB